MRLFHISAISFSVLSLCFLFLPYNSADGGLPLKNIITGIIIWLSLASGIVSQILLSVRLKGKIKSDSTIKKQKIGLITFISNRYAFIADALLAVSIILFILSIFLSPYFGYFNYIIWCILTFSLSMHCILNGKIFNYLLHKNAFKGV